ncbi:DNA polymerase III delta' subunit [Buchnera aphidicola str. Bp (Baizongia pistaciae)]|uniref:DNA polymerase III subunit delta' n=1 Tax=Buchnera aphidicola subsp. Baizongia pistaciae (strain Bp) TaxID=224915 RepID=HOLB_BUCBP|nr:DNA polymerase III subunit delta' C-terminal domain-containing protein [Buchnera aphidicola]Q89AG8.1 RecName: Full=DNA polymerase III subunit delta' [Buchnera aphidicola str. Bp (Baizongia pistaciae)]AAO27046.1 DNA polymerase III delta' subunit [Buchnera aphidicola str. Bp (Baizongia pistaciae)]
MNLYPWLQHSYKQIIYPHYINKGHHSIILESHKNIGITCLAKHISLWLLCQKKNKSIYHCKTCHSCQLMNSKNHPDWHYFGSNTCLSKNSSKTIGVNEVRNFTNTIFNSAQQGQNKIVYIPNIKKLTEFAINSLLKIIEEPPQNTYFLLINYLPHKIITTLRSRCIIHNLYGPTKENRIEWLKEQNINTNQKIHMSMLYSNEISFISKCKHSLFFLYQERLNFFETLLTSFQEKNFLKMLNVLNNKKCLDQIFIWICGIILDSIKWKHDINTIIINTDQTKIIQILASNFSILSLDNSYKSWIYCYNNIKNIPGINIELLFVKQLLYWEEILNIFN